MNHGLGASLLEGSFEPLHERAHAGSAEAAVEVHGLGAHRVDRRRDVTHVVGGARRGVLAMTHAQLLAVDRGAVLPLVGQPARDRLEQHDPQRVDVGTRVDRARVLELLRGHVVDRAQRLPGLGEVHDPGRDVLVTRRLGEPEVREEDLRVFKKKATGQQFTISVLSNLGDNTATFGPPRLSIDYVSPLYICLDSDKDVRFLQTDSCDGSGEDVALAEVDHPLPPNFTSFDPLGRWNMPLKIRLRRVPLPGGDDGGGGCAGPGILPKGDVCISDDDCCSGKCKGGGTKTCK